MKADKADSAAVGEANDSTVSPVANTAAAVKEKHTEKRPVFATVLTQKQTMDANTLSYESDLYSKAVL